MRIRDIARMTGLSASAIRFYEDKGLLAGVRRGGNGYRDYDASDVERLRMIGLAKALGFSLDQVRDVLSEGDGLSKPEVLCSLDLRIDEIGRMRSALDLQMAQLSALKATLQASWSKGECVTMDVCTPGPAGTATVAPLTPSAAP